MEMNIQMWNSRLGTLKTLLRTWPGFTMLLKWYWRWFWQFWCLRSELRNTQEWCCVESTWWWHFCSLILFTVCTPPGVFTLARSFSWCCRLANLSLLAQSLWLQHLILQRGQRFSWDECPFSVISDSANMCVRLLLYGGFNLILCLILIVFFIS